MGTGASADDARKILSFRTNDLDEAAEFLRRNFGDHSRVPRARGALGFGIEVTATDRSVAGSVSFAIPSTVRAANSAVTVHLPLQFGADYAVGRRHLRSAPDVAVMLAPEHVYTIGTPPGDALGIQLDPSLLREAIDEVAMGRTEARRAAIDRDAAVRGQSRHRSRRWSGSIAQHVSIERRDDAGESSAGRGAPDGILAGGPGLSS